MLDVVGSLLDDPTYSDIEFVFPDKTRSTRDDRGTRRSSRKKRPSKRIWACKKILTRADYFEASEKSTNSGSVSIADHWTAVFNSGFSETSAAMVSPSVGGPPQSSAASDNETTFSSDHLHEDSDLDEEAATFLDVASDYDEGEEDLQETEEFRTPLDEHSHLHRSPILNRKPSIGAGGSGLMVTTNEPESSEFVSEDQDRDHAAGSDGDVLRDSNLSPSTAIASSLSRINLQESKREESPDTVLVGSMRLERSHTIDRSPPVPGPPKVRVVVNDVAYTTYYAVLYYVSYHFL